MRHQGDRYKHGDRNIFKSYTSHCRYKGKWHKVSTFVALRNSPPFTHHKTGIGFLLSTMQKAYSVYEYQLLNLYCHSLLIAKIECPWCKRVFYHSPIRKLKISFDIGNNPNKIVIFARQLGIYYGRIRKNRN